jgi:hypothetical protein
VAVCRNQRQAEDAQRLASQVLAPLGLHLNQDQTRIACFTKGAEDFDFLGFVYHER